MDHAITIRDLLWIGGAGLALLVVVLALIWFLSSLDFSE